MLEFNIRNQEISRIDSFSPAEKSVGYLVAKFNFKTDDWNGASKIAVFKNLKTKEEYDRKLEEDACIVPSEALSEKGQFEVSVYGLEDGQKITSNVATCNLNRTLSGGSMTKDNSLSAAEKLLLEAQNKLDKSGHAPNKFLGTDEKGNVVTKEQEEFSLEVAGEEKLGGVKPLNKTDDMTLEVGVDKDGRLFAKGKDITVDSKLSEESENPVQNKVLTKEVNTLKEHNTQLKETIEKLQIKVTTEKASFHNIKDSANMKVVDFGMEGKTEQKTVPGNQLFDYKSDKWSTSIEDIQQTHASVSLVDEGIQLINNVTGSNTWIVVYYEVDVEPNTAYQIKAKHNRNYPLAVCDSSGSTIGSDITCDGKYIRSFTSPSDGKIYIKFSTTRGSAEPNDSTYTEIMLATDASVYEPFTGRMPSPNPGFPQEIKNAGKYNEATGRYEHKFRFVNKNLWNAEYASDVNNWIVFTSYYSYIPVYVGAGKTVTLSYTADSSKDLGCYVGVKRIETQNEMDYYMYHQTASSLSKNPLTITALEDYVYIQINSSAFNYFIQNFNDNIQIEIADTATELLPHAFQQFTLTSDRPITMWDDLVKRDGVYGWSIQAKEYVFDGTEFDLNSNDYTEERMRAYITSALAPKGTECYCNMFRYHPSEGVKGTCGYWFNDCFCTYIPNEWLEPYGFIYNPDDKNTMFTNARISFKALLADKGPIRILVNMQEEQAFHPLLDEEQTLLNNLETYYGVTNVYNEQGCPISLTYVSDPELHWNQKLLQIQQAMI